MDGLDVRSDGLDGMYGAVGMDAGTGTALLGIGTTVPSYRLDQTDTALRLAEALRDNAGAARWAKRIFRQHGIESRYTCEPNLLEPPGSCRYFPRARDAAPSTADRMAVYARESVPLARLAAERALADSRLDPDEITHLITVSCTGQFLPGLDAALVRQLGLAPDVNRVPLTFVGCAAGLKAIGLARQFAAAERDVHVLVVCVELCTLHIQPSDRREDLYAASLFGDGASACVVGRPAADRPGWMTLGRPQSMLLAEGAEDMIWNVGDYGFDLFLSARIPKLIRTHLPGEGELTADEAAGGSGGRVPTSAGAARPALWAIHPGGRGIIDAVQERYGLTDEQTGPSRSVLRQYGNMSSATLLFVLDAIRREMMHSGGISEPRDGMAIAFGPGLSVELLPFAVAARAAVKRDEELGVHA